MQHHHPQFTSSLYACALALGVAASATAQSRVWTVDDDGNGADFAEIQGAVDAAQSGDVVLVRDGTYDGFTVSGKGVAVLAAPGDTVFVSTFPNGIEIAVSAVPAGEQTLIRGIRIGASMFSAPNTAFIDLRDNAGSVWIEDVVIRQMGPLFATIQQAGAVEVINSGDVTLVNSELFGIAGGNTGQEVGACGLSIESGSVFAHGCSFQAGRSGAFDIGGNAGIRVNGGNLVLRDCTVTGGTASGCRSSSSSQVRVDGGPGIDISNGTVWAIQTRFSGGPMGSVLTCTPTSPGAVGPATRTTRPNSLFLSSANATTLQSTRAVPDSGVGTPEVDLDITGRALTDVVLLANLRSQTAFAPGLPGFLGVAVDAVALRIGSTDAAGQLDTQFEIPPLPASVDALSVTVQVVLLNSGATPSLDLSNPSIFTILDDRF